MVVNIFQATVATTSRSRVLALQVMIEVTVVCQGTCLCLVLTQVQHQSCLLLKAQSCLLITVLVHALDVCERVSLIVATTQQLGGSVPTIRMSFGTQPAEDPALFVTFEEEEDDFPSTNRAAVARSQPMPGRRLPPQISAAAQPAANSRQQPPAGTGSTTSSRAPGTGAGKTLSGAEQELEDLKRRIAEKERQMKAKRQTGQGYSGMPVRSRPLPAHGPVLRGLHRKQPSTDGPALGTQEADLFLQQVAAELPSSKGNFTLPGTVCQPHDIACIAANACGCCAIVLSAAMLQLVKPFKLFAAKIDMHEDWLVVVLSTSGPWCHGLRLPPCSTSSNLDVFLVQAQHQVCIQVETQLALSLQQILHHKHLPQVKNISLR